MLLLSNNQTLYRLFFSLVQLAENRWQSYCRLLWKNTHWPGKPKPTVTSGETATHVPGTIAEPEIVSTKAPILLYWKMWLVTSVVVSSVRRKEKCGARSYTCAKHWLSAAEGLCGTELDNELRSVTCGSSSYCSLRLFNRLLGKSWVPVSGYHIGHLGEQRPHWTGPVSSELKSFEASA